MKYKSENPTHLVLVDNARPTVFCGDIKSTNPIKFHARGEWNVAPLEQWFTLDRLQNSWENLSGTKLAYKLEPGPNKKGRQTYKSSPK